MTYQVITTHDNVDNLTDMAPQPRARIMPRAAEVVYYGGGNAEFNGMTYGELEWTALARDEVDALLTQHGLSQNAASGEVTVRLRGRDDAFFNANATAVYLQEETLTPYGWSGFRLRYLNLETITE